MTLTDLIDTMMLPRITPDMVRALHRFDPTQPTLYQAIPRILADAPHRATREQAFEDVRRELARKEHQ